MSLEEKQRAEYEPKCRTLIDFISKIKAEQKSVKDADRELMDRAEKVRSSEIGSAEYLIARYGEHAYQTMLDMVIKQLGITKDNANAYLSGSYENDFDKALRAAVNHNGDSDSTGAVCGNILGAYLGYHAIPQKYKECLELHDQIMDTADQLCNEFVDVLYSKHGNVTLPGIIQVFTIMYLEQLRNPNTNEIKGSAVIDGYPVQITYAKTGEQYQVRVRA